MWPYWHSLATQHFVPRTGNRTDGFFKVEQHGRDVAPHFHVWLPRGVALLLLHSGWASVPHGRGHRLIFIWAVRMPQDNDVPETADPVHKCG